MTKTVEISDTQEQYLSDVLHSVLGDLSYEIANTDKSSFKVELKEKRAQLKAVADQLASQEVRE